MHGWVAGHLALSKLTLSKVALSKLARSKLALNKLTWGKLTRSKLTGLRLIDHHLLILAILTKHHDHFTAEVISLTAIDWSVLQMSP